MSGATVIGGGSTSLYAAKTLDLGSVTNSQSSGTGQGTTVGIRGRVKAGTVQTPHLSGYRTSM
ncbi:hypothetical protein [Acetobacter indonesiensis]|uniref:Uncharacterized protein n=1 Tax=Acetobacter indonesiensis TaxID=104101 RepID=A0A6N3T6L9_9PROT|nr:hypothetical protein [Acetobacter indonesiensis]GAN64150.1 hypothetical protein Abin_054_002 [Acetobacter indonesiensis]GEN04926.1 hypothetical protein AIN02nite_29510 [Acetobacter indonesiensis]